MELCPNNDFKNRLTHSTNPLAHSEATAICQCLILSESK